MSCDPHLNDTYMTEKFKDQLLTIKDFPMTLIVAPAGYGKSTAITWWDEYRKRYIPTSSLYRLNVFGDDLDALWSVLCRLVEKNAPDLSAKLRIIGFPQNEQTMQLLLQLWEQREGDPEQDASDFRGELSAESGGNTQLRQTVRPAPFCGGYASACRLQ